MTDNTTSRQSPQLLVRFPGDLKDRLQAQARANGRTMNAEIMSRLEASFGEQGVAALPNEMEWREHIGVQIRNLGWRLSELEEKAKKTKD